MNQKPNGPKDEQESVKKLRDKKVKLLEFKVQGSKLGIVNDNKETTYIFLTL